MVPEALGKKVAGPPQVRRLLVELPVGVEQRSDRVEVVNGGLANQYAHWDACPAGSVSAGSAFGAMRDARVFGVK
jgi:hypothetical protein